MNKLMAGFYNHARPIYATMPATGLKSNDVNH